VGHGLLLSTLWGYGGYYPYYYGHFPTYGYSAWYNPWTGAYGRSAGVYGPYGGAGVGARTIREPAPTRGAAAYGPWCAGVSQAQPAHRHVPHAQGSNVYGSWGSTAVQRGDDWAKTNRYTNRQTGTTTRTIRTDEGSAVTRRGAGGGAVGVGEGGNVYAGKDGNVYRREDGTWQKYDNGGWSNADRQPGQTCAADRPRGHDGRGRSPRQASTLRRSRHDGSIECDSRARSRHDTHGEITGTTAAWHARAAATAAARAPAAAGAADPTRSAIAERSECRRAVLSPGGPLQTAAFTAS
jgi:hypothetical protein